MHHSSTDSILKLWSQRMKLFNIISIGLFCEQLLRSCATLARIVFEILLLYQVRRGSVNGGLHITTLVPSE